MSGCNKAHSILDRCTPVAPKETKPVSFYLPPTKATIKVKPTTTKIQSEDTVVKQCTKYLRDNGWVTKTIYTGGIMLGGGRFAPNPAKGITDSVNFHPTLKKIIWIEYKKSQGGLLSQEQREFHRLIELSNGIVFVVNSLTSLKEQLDATLSIDN